MKKIFIIVIVSFVFFICGCETNTNKSLQIFKEFESSQNITYRVSVNTDKFKNRNVYEYSIVQNTLVSIELLQGIYQEFYIDLDNKVKYYNGDDWNGMIKLKESADLYRFVKFSDYMSNIKYTNEENYTKIVAKLDFNKLNEKTMLFYHFDKYYQDIDFTSSTIEINITEDLVEYFCIYPNKEENENIFINFDIYKYGNLIYNEIDFKDRYEILDDNDLFNQKVEVDIYNALEKEPPSSINLGYTLRLSLEEYCVKQGGELYINGYVYNNGKFLHYVYLEHLTILGEYNLNVPGVYKLTATTTEDGQVLSTDFTINVIGDNYITASKATNKILKNSKYQFGYDNYYGVCANNKLYLFDLNYTNKYYEFDLKGTGNAYYVKDNYLYVTSYEPYENYSYLDEDEFVGHIIKINLNSYTIEKELTIKRFPYSIIVDKYNEVFISKGHNGFGPIEKVDFETGTLTPLKENISTGSVLLYDEVSESIISISTKSSADPEQYKYDKITNEYKLIKIFSDITSTGICDSITSKNVNKAICESYYCDFTNGFFTYEEIYNYRFKSYYTDHSFNYESESSITNDYVVIAQSYSDGVIVGTFDVKTKVQNNYLISNIVESKISSVHYYNGKIYLFNQTTGELMNFNI